MAHIQIVAHICAQTAGIWNPCSFCTSSEDWTLTLCCSLCKVIIRFGDNPPDFGIQQHLGPSRVVPCCLVFYERPRWLQPIVWLRWGLAGPSCSPPWEDLGAREGKKSLGSLRVHKMGLCARGHARVDTPTQTSLFQRPCIEKPLVSGSRCTTKWHRTRRDTGWPTAWLEL